jgi:hypothetical protein
MFTALTITAILAVMEVSLSFDNAVVNASVLRGWDHFWKTLFLTVGILVAVFGMRLIFPVAIVAVTADMGFVEVVQLALNDPKTYSQRLMDHHPEIYLEKGCLHCGSAATYLIYYTNPHIQKLMLAFIKKYHCVLSREQDLLDLPDFENDYDAFLQTLEHEVNFYARLHHDIIRPFAFETVDSIFERRYALAC